jgi:uncharacterized protein YjbI with pentapeptide repeats
MTALALRAWLGVQLGVCSASQVGVVNVYSKCGGNFLGFVKLKQGERWQAFSDRLAQRAATWMPFGTLPHKYLKVEFCSNFQDYKFTDSKLEERKLKPSKLEESKLEESKLEESKLEESKLEESKLEESKLGYTALVFWDVQRAIEYLNCFHRPTNVSNVVSDCEGTTLLSLKMNGPTLPAEACVYNEATLMRVECAKHLVSELDLASFPCVQNLCVECLSGALINLPPCLERLYLKHSSIKNALTLPSTLKKLIVEAPHQPAENFKDLILDKQQEGSCFEVLAKMVQLEKVWFCYQPQRLGGQDDPQKAHRDGLDVWTLVLGLPNLRHLCFSGMDLQGGIPTEVGRLHLRVLDLDYNRLSGAIPSTLGSNLEVLHLSCNKLSKVIPSELGRIASLEQVYLDNNQLTGKIPTELGLLTNLTELYLQDNLLTGVVPSELGALYTQKYEFEECVLLPNKLTFDLSTLEILEYYNDNYCGGEDEST